MHQMAQTMQDASELAEPSNCAEDRLQIAPRCSCAGGKHGSRRQAFGPNVHPVRPGAPAEAEHGAESGPVDLLAIYQGLRATAVCRGLTTYRDLSLAYSG